MVDLPKSTLEVVLLDPANNKCADCQSEPIKYASVNNAIFLCENCAKEHLELGESTSNIKLATEEILSLKEISLFTIGGNEKFRNYMQNYNLNEFPIKLKYKTNAAEYYRFNVFF